MQLQTVHVDDMIKILTGKQNSWSTSSRADFCTKTLKMCYANIGLEYNCEVWRAKRTL